MADLMNGETIFGVVAIGRNEGERLRICLHSVIRLTSLVVYVDSGSSDGSVAMARDKGVTVVELDLSIPFTAARARNEGFQRLREMEPDLGYVQFVDGDCEVVGEWLEKASRFLDCHADVAVVCGRRRERFPERSVYNMLCDIEWDTPLGESKSCGGDAMIRVSAFEQVGGYRSTLIAGEEPELCLRLRALGWKVWRDGEEMTLHDAALTRFGQWWRRAIRCGYAYAEGAALHGIPPELHRVRESRSVWLWGLGVPLFTLVAVWCIGVWGATLLAIYPIQVVRLGLRGSRPPKANWWRALFLVLGKFPEVVGQMKFFFYRLAGKNARLIEYK